ncbi:MAG: cytochrome c, partial [Anaerolineae bacterium]|nr:cytochrome c [Anaerolineae bacterium]
MMNEPTPDRSGDSLPLLPLIILFGGVALLLLALFSANPTQREDPIQMTQQAEATAAVIAAQATATLPPTEPPVVTVALDPEAVRRGSTIFSTVCSACHGFDARGIPGLGKTLIGSQFANSLSDDDLVAFIIQGRLPFDPLNTTGVAMPPRGGNPILSDADLYNVVAYIRSLNLDQPAVPTQPPGAPTTVPTAAPPTAVPPTRP